MGWSGSRNNYPTLKNCFGAVTLTRSTDIDKYKYSGYGIGFDRRSSFSFPDSRFGQNISIFEVDMSSSAHTDNKKDIFVLGKEPTQGLKHTLTREKMYSINFTVTKEKLCFSLYYNGANSYLFVKIQKLLNLKQKILKL